MKKRRNGTRRITFISKSKAFMNRRNLLKTAYTSFLLQDIHDHFKTLTKHLQTQVVNMGPMKSHSMTQCSFLTKISSCVRPTTDTPNPPLELIRRDTDLKRRLLRPCRCRRRPPRASAGPASSSPTATTAATRASFMTGARAAPPPAARPPLH